MGATKYGSGTTAGVGYGNKSIAASEGGKEDSLRGKMMEKVGGMLKNEKMVEKGSEMRGKEE